MTTRAGWRSSCTSPCARRSCSRTASRPTTWPTPCRLSTERLRSSEVRRPPEGPRLAQGREHVVATTDEIPRGGVKVVPIGRHGVGVYNVNGTYYAIANYCPHEGGPLCSGRLRGRTVTDPDPPADPVMVPHLEFIPCPCHQW